MRREHDLFDSSNEDLFEFFDINKDHYISMDEFSQRLKGPKGLHETWFFCNGLTFFHPFSSLESSFLSIQWSINAHRNLFLLPSGDQPCTIEQRNSSSRRCRPDHSHFSFFSIFVEMLMYCFSLFIQNFVVSSLWQLEKSLNGTNTDFPHLHFGINTLSDTEKTFLNSSQLILSEPSTITRRFRNSSVIKFRRLSHHTFCHRALWKSV